MGQKKMNGITTGKLVTRSWTSEARRSGGTRRGESRVAHISVIHRTKKTLHRSWYGNIAINNSQDKLTIDFKPTPRMGGALDHWQYDTFITRFSDKTIEPAYVTFNLDADGKIGRITMKPVSPRADFSPPTY